MTILDKIVAATRLRVEREKAACPPDRLEPAPPRASFAFEHALSGPDIAFICEVKKASPSKGLIAPHFPYLAIAREYQQAGAAAISVLTEPDFFQGRNRYLREIGQEVTLPLLRKDFIIDPYQIHQAASLGAGAVLLICSILSDAQLSSFLELTGSLGLSALVEAHDEPEVKRALACGARLIGVNNRDLKTFEVDLQTSIRLRSLAPSSVLFVSESGISSPQDIDALRKNGVNAVLVGESLMRSPDKAAALAHLRGGRAPL